MTLPYGFIKGKMTSHPRLQAKTIHNGQDEETQYHLHFSVDVDGADWDIAANVGTNNGGDLLRYKIVQSFKHPIVQTLRAAPQGKNDLTGVEDWPALDFLRSDILQGTGEWVTSDVLTGSEDEHPVADLKALIEQAFLDQNVV